MTAGRLAVVLVALVIVFVGGIMAVDAAVDGQTDPSEETQDFADLFGTLWGDIGQFMPVVVVAGMAFLALLALRSGG